MASAGFTLRRMRLRRCAIQLFLDQCYNHLVRSASSAITEFGIKYFYFEGIRGSSHIKSSYTKALRLPAESSITSPTYRSCQSSMEYRNTKRLVGVGRAALADAAV